MAVECRIAGNVRGVGCVPYRRQDGSAKTGREHSARCDRREGECTGGPRPPVVDRNGTFQPLSGSVRCRGVLVVMDCRRRATP
eukprot:4251092-Prymnesium_polylepis.1